MALTRREFGLAGISLVLTACSDRSADLAARSSSKNLILGGGIFQDRDTGEVRRVISVVDIDTRSRSMTDTSFLPHGIHRKPTDTNCLALFEKIGPGACEYDLAAREITRYLPAAQGRYFYGHGAYSVDGEVLYSTETELHNGDGVIAVRDSESMELLGEFPTFGKEPHECKLIDGGNTMVVTNGGGDLLGDVPSVTYIDIASERLLEKVELTNARLNTGHVAVDNSGNLVVVSAPRLGLDEDQLGGVSIRLRGDVMQTIANPESVTQRMIGEALSVIIHPDAGLAAVTHPYADIVTIWTLNDRRLVKVIDLPSARGVELTLDKKDFIVSYGSNANLVRIPVDTLEPDKSSIVEETYITGSHIYNWSRDMSELFYPGPLV